MPDTTNIETAAGTAPEVVQAAPQTAPKRKRGRPRKDATAAVTADPLDRKLNHFLTTKDDRDLEWWEHDQTVSPLDTSKFRAKHPDRRFRWTSEKRWDRLGKNYHGWQVYTDGEHPDGIKRGSDFLTWMPEEKAARYNKYVSETSSSRVRNQQQSETEKRSRVAGLDGFSEVEGGLKIGSRPMTGMLVNGKFVPAGRGKRGYSLDELKEAHVKQQEQRAKGRKYFT